MLGLTEHGDQRRHLVEEHVDVLRAESGVSGTLGGARRHGGAGTEGRGGPRTVGLCAQWEARPLWGLAPEQKPK